MRNPMRTYAGHPLWILAVLVGLGGGCKTAENRVVLEINMAGFSPEIELDRVEVTIAASSTEQGDALCVPATVLFAVDSADATDLPVADFPLRIAVKPGQEFNKILYVRVLGWQSGTVRLKTERMVSLQGGDVQLQLLLPVDCLGVGTGVGQHCVGGLAMESPYGRIFDDNLNVASGAPSCLEE